MSIEDDLAEQERWERMPSYYKRNTPPLCPELVSERTKLEMLTTDDWLEKIKALESQLAEKDAIIDWLAQYLHKIHKTNYIPEYIVAKNYSVKRWKEIAQDEVRK